MKDRFLEMEGVAMKQRVGNLLDQSVFGVCVVNEDTYDIFEPEIGTAVRETARRKTPRARKCVLEEHSKIQLPWRCPGETELVVY